jgi:hypothetical protein
MHKLLDRGEGWLGSGTKPVNPPMGMTYWLVARTYGEASLHDGSTIR